MLLQRRTVVEIVVSIFEWDVFAFGMPSENVWDEACGIYTLGMDIVLIYLFRRVEEFIPVLKPIPDVKVLAYTRIVSCCMVQCANQNIRLPQGILTTTFRSVLLPVIIDETSCA